MKNKLEQLIETLGVHFSPFHSFSEPLLDIAKVIQNYPVIVDWIRHQTISDDGILQGIAIAERIVRHVSCQDESSLIVKDFCSDPAYKEFADSVFNDISEDLRNNQGRRFRRILKALNGEEVAFIFENEDFRDWLLERQNQLSNQELTIYDFEPAVAAAVILRIIDTLYVAQRNAPSPN